LLSRSDPSRAGAAASGGSKSVTESGYVTEQLIRSIMRHEIAALDSGSCSYDEL
jgi:hypothetical protein